MGNTHRHAVSRRIQTLVALAAMVALLIVAAPAGAQTGQSSAQQGYSGSGEKVQSSIDPKGPNLPFTGLDVFAVLAVGGALVAVGLGVRRLSRTTA
jgi:hypothetical protein